MIYCYTYCDETMDLLSNGFDLIVTFLESVVTVSQVEQSVILLFFPGEQWKFAPSWHEFLHFFYVALGILYTFLKVHNLVTSALDVLPDTLNTQTWTNLTVSLQCLCIM